MKSQRLVACMATAIVLLIGSSGCSSPANGVGGSWSPSEELPPVGATVPHTDYYFDYPDASQLWLPGTVVVARPVAMDSNVLIDGTATSEPWVYTPVTFEVVETLSGEEAGDRLTLAVAGGTAQGLYHRGLFEFDKRALKSGGLFVISISQYDYPGFELGVKLDSAYALNSHGRLRPVQFEDLEGQRDSIGDGIDMEVLRSFVSRTGGKDARARLDSAVGEWLDE